MILKEFWSTQSSPPAFPLRTTSLHLWFHQLVIYDYNVLMDLPPSWLASLRKKKIPAKMMREHKPSAWTER
jgi:hypothetical protein